jgi:flagellin-like hook-associated protein FlgL
MFDATINASLLTQANTQRALISSLNKISNGSKNDGLKDYNQELSNLRTSNKSLALIYKNTNKALTANEVMYNSLKEQKAILGTIKIKLIELNNASLSTEKQTQLGNEIKVLAQKIDIIASNAKHGETYYLQSSDTSDAISKLRNYQIGNNFDDTSSLVQVQSNTEGLGIKADLVTNTTNATDAKDDQALVDIAITTMNGYLSSVSNNIKNLEISHQNISDKLTINKNLISQIDGVDYTNEKEIYTKLKNIHQASLFSMQKANDLQNTLLKLLDPQYN